MCHLYYFCALIHLHELCVLVLEFFVACLGRRCGGGGWVSKVFIGGVVVTPILRIDVRRSRRRHSFEVDSWDHEVGAIWTERWGAVIPHLLTVTQIGNRNQRGIIQIGWFWWKIRRWVLDTAERETEKWILTLRRWFLELLRAVEILESFILRELISCLTTRSHNLVIVFDRRREKEKRVDKNRR
jgi:hypothetical protein